MMVPCSIGTAGFKLLLLLRSELLPICAGFGKMGWKSIEYWKDFAGFGFGGGSRQRFISVLRRLRMASNEAVAPRRRSAAFGGFEFFCRLAQHESAQFQPGEGREGDDISRIIHNEVAREPSLAPLLHASALHIQRGTHRKRFLRPRSSCA